MANQRAGVGPGEDRGKVFRGQKQRDADAWPKAVMRSNLPPTVDEPWVQTENFPVTSEGPDPRKTSGIEGLRRNVEEELELPDEERKGKEASGGENSSSRGVVAGPTPKHPGHCQVAQCPTAYHIQVKEIHSPARCLVPISFLSLTSISWPQSLHL